MTKENLKVLCVLYDDPVEQFPPNYARDDIPKITSYPGGQKAPTPEKIDFNPGELLGCWLDDKPIRDEYLIVQGGSLAGTGAHSYSKGNATGGSDEAARFKES